MRALSLGFLFFLCLLIAPRPAGAVGLVLHGDTAQVRLVVAPSALRTVRWYSLSMGDARPFLWVIPTGKNATVDLVSNAWLEALDEVSAVRVTPSCGSAAPEIFRSVALGVTPQPTQIDTVTAPEELDAKIDDPDLTDGVRSELVARLATQNLVVVRTAGPHTPTLRVVDTEAETPIPMSLLRTSRTVEVTAFVVAERPSVLGTMVPGPTSLQWFGGHSDYLLKRDGALAGKPAGAFVVETSATSVPSATAVYFERAARYGGRADDVELALAQHAPDALYVTRLSGRILGYTMSPDLNVAGMGGVALPPSVRVATATCGSGGGSSGGGGSSPPPPPRDSYESSGCSGSSDTGYGRSGGSGSSSSSSSESCSSDTSDSSGSSSDGESCSSDTSDSGSSGDDDDDSGESCDSDDDGSSSDDEEEACGASEDKRSSKGRSPLSRSVLALALVVFPLRRWGRRRPPTR